MCGGERRNGGRGRGEQKYACPISLFFWETPYAGKRSSWLVRHREVDWCLSINCKSILFRSGWECRVYYAMRKSKQFLNWPSGQDLLAVLKSTPLLPHAKMLLVPIRFFFLASRCSLEGSMFWQSKCDFSLLFHTERSWHAYWFSVVLNFWSSWFSLWYKSVFFDLFWSVKLFLSLNKAVRFFIFVQSASGSE